MTPELTDYIESHIAAEPSWLRLIDRRTQLRLVNPRMCSGHLQGRLLKMLTLLHRPVTVLELGTYSAYSTLCIAEALPAQGVIHTIESNDELEDFIRSSLASAPCGHKVQLHIGEALSLIESVAPGSTFDMVYIDADKREYSDYYLAVKPRMSPGGLIVADNILWDGHVAELGRNDSQTLGIRRYNDMVAADPDVETVILPVRDGLSLTYFSDRKT